MDRFFAPFTLDESRVDLSGKTKSLQAAFEHGKFPAEHIAFDFHQFTMTVDLLHLGIQQLGCHLPDLLASAIQQRPTPKVGLECIEVQLEAIGREDRGAGEFHAAMQAMHHSHGHIEAARA